MVWGMILTLIEITKLIILAIYKFLELWFAGMKHCFLFLASSFTELYELKWEKEEDKPKIIKNVSILLLSVAAIIFLIWFLFYVFSFKWTVSNRPNTAYNTNISNNKKYGWEVAPNSPNNFVFYDENGQMLKNKDYQINGFWYYFDNNGYMITNKWNGNYYYGADGKMASNTWVGDYYVGTDGAKLKNTVTPDGYTVGTDGKYISTIPRETTNIKETQATLPPQTTANIQKNNTQYNQGNIVAETTQYNNANVKELYIANTEVINDYFDYSWTSNNDNYNVDGCIIFVSKPIIAGTNPEEAAIINSQIDQLIPQFIDRIKDEDVLSNTYKAISSVNLDKPELKYTDNKVTISLSGKNTYTTDYYKNTPTFPKFIIEYHRKDKTSKMYKEMFGGGELNLDADDIFYAE